MKIEGEYKNLLNEDGSAVLLVGKVRKDNDKQAFEVIFKNYHKPLFGYAYSFVRQSQAAEDIIQTVFLNIWANRKTWHPQGSLTEYLFKAVRNRSLNFLKREQMVVDLREEMLITIEELMNDEQPFEQIFMEKFKKQLQISIDKLPLRCREIYLLHRISGLTYTEIADYLEISVNTVNTQMARALKFLREELIDYHPYHSTLY